MASLTSANAIITLTIASVFPAPQTLQGFATDDMFSLEAFAPTEVMMGVDGILSAGYTPAPKTMTITFQADSPSLEVFENWYAAQQTIKEAIVAMGVVNIPAVARAYTLVRGFLTSYTPAPTARKLLQPRPMTITWQDIISAPSGV